jgi:hypothetical protein
MNIWTSDKLIIFILFIVPGFISLKIYRLLVPGEINKLSDIIIEAIAYSCLNYALFSWLIFLDIHFKIYQNFLWLHLFIIFFLLFISPIIISFIFWLIRYNLKKTIFFHHPIPKPWDYVFSKKEPYWIIIELNDGQRIGGVYEENSFASSYPNDEQIYLEQYWKIDGSKFIQPIHRTKGIMLSRENIKKVEFYK